MNSNQCLVFLYPDEPTSKYGCSSCFQKVLFLCFPFPHLQLDLLVSRVPWRTRCCRCSRSDHSRKFVPFSAHILKRRQFCSKDIPPTQYPFFYWVKPYLEEWWAEILSQNFFLSMIFCRFSQKYQKIIIFCWKLDSQKNELLKCWPLSKSSQPWLES